LTTVTSIVQLTCKHDGSSSSSSRRSRGGAHTPRGVGSEGARIKVWKSEEIRRRGDAKKRKRGEE
jgi:hypothetical protein